MASNRRIAILYAYNGSQFQGLESPSKTCRKVTSDPSPSVRPPFPKDPSASAQSKASSSPPSHLSSPPADPSKRIVLSNISRASTTEEGEHAARQVMSVEVVGTDPEAADPTPDALNSFLPESLRVFEVIRIQSGFSARRTCDSRVYEYLIPTYVFTPPPPETHYFHPPDDVVDLPEDEEVFPADKYHAPPGGLFKTIKRNMSLSRSKSMGRNKSLRRGQPIPDVADLMPGTAPAAEPTYTEPAPEEKKGVFRRFFDTLTRKGSKSPRPREDEPPRTAMTLGRMRTTSNATSRSRANSTAVPFGGSPPNVTFSTSAPAGADDTGLLSTLRRNASRRSNRGRQTPETGLAEDPDAEDDIESEGPQYYDPLPLPKATPEQLAALRSYRISPQQVEALSRIIGIYNGTHNWHNFIPGGKYDDPRCYMRILNIECSAPEEHAGMEWIRIKVQAKAFARFQVRKMIALAIMVIRTNTPRSIVGNSFGFASLDIPEAPGHCAILDTPHYDIYNSDCARRGDPSTISFEHNRSAITAFRHREIHDAIYRAERECMLFEPWLRAMDSYSFLYAHFLNARGVIRPCTAFVRPEGDGLGHARVVTVRGATGGASVAVPAPVGLFDPEPAAV
ncbi:pseudouridine synthase [Blyttiomyces helicus]|uniref:Pseudouridine synthase n=1 Tax=Blyttiomyces helicus TaxID=388810 RepID=A0A4P9WD53_9FUNG|nr:pseudouridine synthase [Blyttiomyces helicus]|eukprot:RKO88306.1 pseudouridine synthase [Blyttiomyces helicus]